jgi:hypothetical protein
MVGDKSDLNHLWSVPEEDGQAFSEKEGPVLPRDICSGGDKRREGVPRRLKRDSSDGEQEGAHRAGVCIQQWALDFFR